MKKTVTLIIVLCSLVSCKSNKNSRCDAYGQKTMKLTIKQG